MKFGDQVKVKYTIGYEYNDIGVHSEIRYEHEDLFGIILNKTNRDIDTHNITYRVAMRPTGNIAHVRLDDMGMADT